MRRVWLLGMAACYSPSIHTGSPCDDTHPCPAELVCSPATMSCERTSTPAPDGSGMPGPDGGTCYGTGLFHACFQTPPTMDVTFGTSTILDTDTDTRCTYQSGACVIAGANLTVAAMLRATGTHPLVLVGTSSILVMGTIDVSSRRATGGNLPMTGAGSDPAACVPVPEDAFPTGGPGGSFVTRGGKGGDITAGAGMLAAATTPATSLRGGCAGTAGGSSGGTGGHGGGAVYLISAGKISINGTIDASGQGGAGGQLSSGQGGGGGGAGGLIGLDAPAILASGASIFANGGGGGSGGTPTKSGNAGADPSSPTIPASGGSAGSFGSGVGGAGSISSNPGQPGGNGSAAGGGGGGGGGAVRVFPLQPLQGASVSPPPT